MTIVLPATGAGALEEAREALEAGHLVALPTDASYVIVVNPFLAGVTDRLFSVLRRSRDQDLTAFVASRDQVDTLATAVPAGAERLMARHWPGPLTLVLPRRPDLAADLGDDDLTVGVRMPGHPVPRTLAARLGPLAVATAASPAGPAFTAAEAVAAAYDAVVAVVLDGGSCLGGQSTVVDASGEEPLLIREGRILWSELKT